MLEINLPVNNCVSIWQEFRIENTIHNKGIKVNDSTR